MSDGVIEALRADREVLLEIGAQLGPSEWKAPSGCPGWSVQDLFAHVGALFWMVVDGSQLPDTAGLPTERAQDVLVEARRSWDAERVLADYTEISTKAIDALAGLAAGDFEMSLGDLGTYPAAVLPNAYAFDHFTHIRFDLFPPRGPLGPPAPASDEIRLTAALDWIEAALPQMNTDRVSALPGVAELVVTGEAHRTLTVGSGDTVVRVESDGPGFVRWVTQRGTWDDVGARASGDQAALALVAQLKVF
jgi:uncharacterized protein (TIGR03083 family)